MLNDTVKEGGRSVVMGGCGWGVKNRSRVEMMPELDRKEVLARQNTDAVEVGG